MWLLSVNSTKGENVSDCGWWLSAQTPVAGEVDWGAKGSGPQGRRGPHKRRRCVRFGNEMDVGLRVCIDVR